MEMGESSGFIHPQNARDAEANERRSVLPKWPDDQMALFTLNLGTRSAKIMKIEWYQNIFGEDEPEPGYGRPDYFIVTDNDKVKFSDLSDAIDWIIKNPEKSFALWNNNIIPELILIVTQ